MRICRHKRSSCFRVVLDVTFTSKLPFSLASVHRYPCFDGNSSSSQSPQSFFRSSIARQSWMLSPLITARGSSPLSSSFWNYTWAPCLRADTGKTSTETRSKEGCKCGSSSTCPRSPAKRQNQQNHHRQVEVKYKQKFSTSHVFACCPSTVFFWC